MLHNCVHSLLKKLKHTWLCWLTLIFQANALLCFKSLSPPSWPSLVVSLRYNWLVKPVLSFQGLNVGCLYHGGSYCLVAKSSPTLCDPMDCSPPGSSVCGSYQTEYWLVWVAISYSRGSSWSRDQTRISCTGRQILYATELPGKPLNSGILLLKNKF